MVDHDGLTDAENEQQEAPSGSHAIEQKFLKAIEEFTQGMPQTDDITFVVIEKCQ